MKPGRLWPLALVGVLGVTVIAYAAMFMAARDPSSEAVEKDYYRKAVAWDSTQAQERRDALLGWRADAALSPRDAAGLSLVRCTLADSAGRPLDGARVELTATHNLEAEAPVHAALAGTGGGAYEARLPLRRDGMWELQLSALLGGRRFTATLRRDLPRGAAK